jgi:hypothetical protein
MPGQPDLLRLADALLVIAHPSNEDLREELAKIVYELDPYFEPGERVDGFLVSPGGNLSWEQAKDRDAEFGGLKGFLSITEYSYKVADAVLARLSQRP